jgi:hypothetical protein
LADVGAPVTAPFGYQPSFKYWVIKAAAPACTKHTHQNKWDDLFKLIKRGGENDTDQNILSRIKDPRVGDKTLDRNGDGCDGR